VVGGDYTVTGEDSNEIHWGVGIWPDYKKSGLRFDGEGTQTFSEGEKFPIGTLTHMNWPVGAPTATGATLQITIEFKIPEVSPNPQFSFDFDINETPNNYPCADWHTGTYPCDDKITFPNQYGDKSFTIGDKLYTLKIEGFVDSLGNTVDKFITHEKQNNSAVLRASLSSVLVAAPDITITKKTNGINVESAPGPSLNVDDTVTWQYVVQNTGNVELKEITVVDDEVGTITCPETVLAAGDLMTCEATGTVVAEQYTNTATVTGTPAEGGDVTDSDSSYYFGANPSISLEKTADVATYSDVGETITYTFTVTNTGNVTLTDVEIDDALNLHHHSR